MRRGALRCLAVLLSAALVVVGCGEDSAAPSGQNLTALRVAMFPAGATLPGESSRLAGRRCRACPSESSPTRFAGRRARGAEPAPAGAIPTTKA